MEEKNDYKLLDYSSHYKENKAHPIDISLHNNIDCSDRKPVAFYFREKKTFLAANTVSMLLFS